ncbi:MAG: hypothetical protein KF729_36545 [Sandaracinaceae bacterium]|nr:hypothetical protein [Sandaracinaceae bacterium]
MSDDPVETTWQEVLAAFDDEAVHKKFLALSAGLGRLGDAGARYRAIKDAPDDPRAAMASAQVEKLIALAMQNLDGLKSPPPNKSTTKTVLLLVAFGVSGAMILHAVWTLARSM